MYWNPRGALVGPRDFLLHDGFLLIIGLAIIFTIVIWIRFLIRAFFFNSFLLNTGTQ
jgi:hypothetical protein